ATISDSFLAIITREGLTVFQYGPATAGTNRKVGTLPFDGWDPTCLAIHEGNDRTWICVGGRWQLTSGSIRMYQIEYNHGRPTLSRHSVSFDQLGPDPLKSDFPKMVYFGPDAGRLVCLTINNS